MQYLHEEYFKRNLKVHTVSKATQEQTCDKLDVVIYMFSLHWEPPKKETFTDEGRLLHPFRSFIPPLSKWSP